MHYPKVYRLTRIFGSRDMERLSGKIRGKHKKLYQLQTPTEKSEGPSLSLQARSHHCNFRFDKLHAFLLLSTVTID